jgi:hypothetical protein
MNTKYSFLDYKAAHNYVDSQNDNVFWDGWDMVIFKPSPVARTRSNGMLRNGVWGTAHRIRVSERGTWRVPVRK